MKSKEVKKMSFYKKVPGLVQTLESALLFDTKPTKGSTNPVTSDGVNTAITESVGTLIENETEIGTDYGIVTDAEGAAAYSVGKFYKLETQLMKCTSISNSGDTYTVEFDVLSGIAAALNDLVDRIEALSE